MVYLLWQLTRDIGSTVGLDVFGFGVTDLILTLILRSIVGASLLRAAFRRKRWVSLHLHSLCRRHREQARSYSAVSLLGRVVR